MSSFEYLSATTKTALRKGRAIPMLFNHRPDEMPGHTLTVVGLVDSKTFEGVFLPDDFTGTGLVSMKLPECEFEFVDIQTDCADAKAVHELWSAWNGGVGDRYLAFVRVIALSLSLVELDRTLETATTVEAPERTPADPGASPKRGASKKRATGKKRPATPVGKAPRSAAKARKRRSP
jgi:hypothetical protein